MVNIIAGSYVIKDVRLMIFDKDGTLMDLYTYWFNMIDLRVTLAQKRLGFDNSVKNQVAYEMGVDQKNRRLRENGPVGLKKREIVMQAMIDSLSEAGYPNTYVLCEEIFSEADQLSIKILPDIIKPINGMYRFIKSLHESGCLIAIATTDKTERAEIAMKILNISDMVHLVVGADMIEQPKPSPEMIDYILNKLNSESDHAIMVGDAITDVQMGINAKLCASIGVSSGLAKREQLLEVTPYVISDVSEIEVMSVQTGVRHEKT